MNTFSNAEVNISTHAIKRFHDRFFGPKDTWKATAKLRGMARFGSEVKIAEEFRDDEMKAHGKSARFVFADRYLLVLVPVI